METPERARRAIEAAWRIEAPRLIGGLLRLVRDVSVAEDLAHEALLSALEQWPEAGIPQNPGAWLMMTAKNRAIDELRHRAMRERKLGALGPGVDRVEPDFDEAEDVGDDVLRLMLVACHPLLPAEGRAALTLRLLGGLSTDEIARAFLVPEPTVAQRVVRAKRTLAEARVPFDVPRGAELARRLPSVLEVIYLIFNEGYSATSGADLVRPDLCSDALRLARVLAGLLPGEPEVWGLLSLLELQASRLKARVDPGGEIVLLQDQDRARWDHLAVRRGLDALARAVALSSPLGVYTLQAAIAACHARAASAASTPWHRIVALYDALVEATGSPVVELNRAVAVAMALGPAEGLALVDELNEDPALRGYHPLPAVRADLLLRLGRLAEARAEFERAASLAGNERERRFLLGRARGLALPRGAGVREPGRRRCREPSAGAFCRALPRAAKFRRGGARGARRARLRGSGGASCRKILAKKSLYGATIRPMSSPGSGSPKRDPGSQERHFRPSLWRRVLMPLVAVFLLGAALFNDLLEKLDLPIYSLRGKLVGACLLALVAAIVLHRSGAFAPEGVSLSPAGISLRHGARRDSVRWSDITSLWLKREGKIFVVNLNDGSSRHVPLGTFGLDDLVEIELLAREHLERYKAA